jgi:FkbM family methyltransferase
VEIIPFSSALRMGCPIVISMKLWAAPAAKIAEAGGSCEAFAHAVFRASLKQMTRIVESLRDDRSRLVYLTILKANILADYSVYASVFEGNQYWAIPEFQYLPDSSGVMVDAGSYVGDTVEEFVWRTRGMFKRIYAFEPDARCFRALEIRASRLRQEWGLPDEAIRCVAAGLGEKSAQLPFFQHPCGSDGSFLFASGKPNGTLTVRKLDDYLGEDGLTFLKADIEGYEMPLLLGAIESIKKHRPKLAIFIYHRITDLIEIPLLLREMVPEYKMAVRHHSFGQDESVLYCWV